MAKINERDTVKAPNTILVHINNIYIILFTILECPFETNMLNTNERETAQ